MWLSSLAVKELALLLIASPVCQLPLPTLYCHEALSSKPVTVTVASLVMVSVVSPELVKLRVGVTGLVVSRVNETVSASSEILVATSV